MQLPYFVHLRQSTESFLVAKVSWRVVSWHIDDCNLNRDGDLKIIMIGAGQGAPGRPPAV